MLKKRIISHPSLEFTHWCLHIKCVTCSIVLLLQVLVKVQLKPFNSERAYFWSETRDGSGDTSAPHCAHCTQACGGSLCAHSALTGTWTLILLWTFCVNLAQHVWSWWVRQAQVEYPQKLSWGVHLQCWVSNDVQLQLRSLCAPSFSLSFLGLTTLDFKSEIKQFFWLQLWELSRSSFHWICNWSPCIILLWYFMFTADTTKCSILNNIRNPHANNSEV